jgi:lipopolysaccharide biosynthesis protein
MKSQYNSIPKVIAMYLPQYHEIPENNEWWGKGFTEWTNVKKAQPLYKGHLQPRVPLGEDYYDLSDENELINQMDLAKKYGIDGFCFYHYWFSGKKLLEKPIERLLSEKRELLPFCLCWANEPWTRTWDGQEGSKQILMPQCYGSVEEWKQHYQYLNSYFKKDEYIKVDGKPLIIIYKQSEIPNIKEMLACWDEMAKQEHFAGVFVLNVLRIGIEKECSLFGNGTIDFEPFATFSRIESGYIDKISHIYLGNRKENYRRKYRVIDYSRFCEKMTSRYTLKDCQHYLGLFAGWDNTPRQGKNTTIIFENNTPENFGKYFDIQYRRSIELENQFLFINAWNEWGEGTFLQPDQKYKYGYLEKIRSVKEKYVSEG